MTVWVLRSAALLFGAAVVAGFAGALHPVGDSLAVFRVPLAAGAAMLWLAFWQNRWVLPAGLVAFGTVLFGQWMGAQKIMIASDYNATVYQKNLLFIVADQRRLERDIEVQQPDVITLQEVSSRNEHILETLAPSYPAQQSCPFAGVGAVAVLSRWPKIEGSGTCRDRNGMAAMQVLSPTGPIWVISIHLHWPWPYGQAGQVRKLETALRALEGDKLIGGDFNMVAWGNTIRRIESASATKRVGHNATTFHLPKIKLGVAIDHVLASSRMASEIYVRPKFGSDHNGVAATLNLNNAE